MELGLLPGSYNEWQMLAASAHTPQGTPSFAGRSLRVRGQVVQAGTATNLSADELDSKDSTAFLASGRIYSVTVTGPSTANSDFVITATCDFGDGVTGGGSLARIKLRPTSGKTTISGVLIRGGCATRLAPTLMQREEHYPRPRCRA